MNALNLGAWILGAGTVVALLLNGTHLLRMIRDSVWAPFVLHLRKVTRKDKEYIDAELEDLRRQVAHLTRVVSELRVRDEMTWQWVLTDQSWHREYELDCAEKGIEPRVHVSYADFRERWLKDHEGWHPFT